MSDTAEAPARGQRAERDYEVGYCKPPRHSQFKKGKSGNPRGIQEPKTAPEAARDQLHQTMTITANGKRRRITRLDGLMMALTRNAMDGKEKSAKLLLDMIDRLPPPARGPTQEEHQAIMEEVISRTPVEDLEVIDRFNKVYIAVQQERSKK